MPTKKKEKINGADMRQIFKSAAGIAKANVKGNKSYKTEFTKALKFLVDAKKRKLK